MLDQSGPYRPGTKHFRVVRWESAEARPWMMKRLAKSMTLVNQAAKTGCRKLELLASGQTFSSIHGRSSSYERCWKLFI